MLRVIFGGTFDPIHNGHVTTSLAAFAELEANQMHVVPSAQPPHRDYPGASAGQRLAMVKLAFAECPGVLPDDCELRRDGPSYSLLTLQEMRRRWPDDNITFLLGNDAFAKLDTWYGWQQLTEVANLAVMRRADQDTPWSPAVEALYHQHGCDALSQFHQHRQGQILLLETPDVAISATALREAIAENKDWREKVPVNVATYIEQYRLYGL
ncbi:nicotinate-nucleotide adenylyltransferase [Pseudidiomarina insulisalsae]|uniref:Probable nicotinate-nucleotide adenylyltransferase n=1 Tax=Pseudidiomarina insulisalsae TaxID=575789 RepID=A0A432YES0_9GAMM|nr:nicotinate-nucleotide adenylyltransferase [Pseudidiomarina insulisalsae]RUO59452.1 nicotinate-nucleotide adenylyltransferase [Pseudidiomarina insulisalsae]